MWSRDVTMNSRYDVWDEEIPADDDAHGTSDTSAALTSTRIDSLHDEILVSGILSGAFLNLIP